MARHQHHLPIFPDTVIPTFESMCGVLPLEAVSELRLELTKRREELSRVNPEDMLNAPETYYQIIDRCEFLLSQYETARPKEKSLIMGAVRYFLCDEDAVPDSEFASGLDDDVKVINYVLERLDIHDQFLPIPSQQG